MLDWNATAAQAEVVLDSDTPSEARLEALRDALAEQRNRALTAQDGYKTRIARLQNQLDALGPVPDETEAEAADVAQRRADLVDEIAQARAPVVAAEEAYRRADGLIGAIDDKLREDFNERLVQRGPSPLVPTHWLTALAEIQSRAGAIQNEAARRLRITTTRDALLPALLLALVSLVMLIYLRPGILRRVEVMAAAQTVSHYQIWIIAGLNFLRFMVPLAAAYLAILAITLVNPVPLTLPQLDETMAYGAVVICVAYWLASSLFSPRQPSLSVAKFENPHASRCWRNVMLLGLIPAITALLTSLNVPNALEPATRAVLHLPVTIIGAILLFFFCRRIRPRKSDQALTENEDAPEEPASEPVWRVFLSIIARGGVIVAIAAPIAAAAGYLNASLFLLVPAILTLGVLAVGFVFFDLFQRGVDSWLARSANAQTANRLGLLPVLAGFGIICLSIPALALIWGARVSDLTEMWVYLRDGVSFGNSRISVTDFLSFALVFGIGYTITRFLQTLMRGSVLPRTNLDSGGRNAVVSGIGYVGFFLAAVLAISATGLDLSNLAIVAGALSVGVGFGLQTIVSNFVSGIILLIERPIKIGDWIEVGGQSGYVRSINVRSTEIQTFDRATVIVPNADLIAGSVLNWTHSSMAGRVVVKVGVGYGSDPRQVESILQEIANAHPMVMRRPAPSVVFMGFGADSLDFEIRAILRDVNYMLSARSDMNYEIFERFAKEGIEIPFAQRDVTIKNAGDFLQTSKS